MVDSDLLSTKGNELLQKTRSEIQINLCGTATRLGLIFPSPWWKYLQRAVDHAGLFLTPETWNRNTSEGENHVRQQASCRPGGGERRKEKRG